MLGVQTSHYVCSAPFQRRPWPCGPTRTPSNKVRRVQRILSSQRLGNYVAQGTAARREYLLALAQPDALTLVSCKSRRIKCDQAKPSCRRCRIGHRVCVYDHTLPKEFDHLQSPDLMCNGYPSLSSLTSRRPSGTDDARRLTLFQYYCEQIAPSCTVNGGMSKPSSPVRRRP